jgi:WD40 repeat protein
MGPFVNPKAALPGTETSNSGKALATGPALIRGWDRIMRFVFGRDMFISYSRRDSSKYAPALVLALQAKQPRLSFYLDRWIAPSSSVLPRSLQRHLRWSSLMIVVCTENAVSPSSFVRQELREFSDLDRKIIPVDTGSFGLLRSDEELWEQIGGEDPEPESGDAVANGQPSEHVVSRILNAVQFTTQQQRLQRGVWATLVLIAVAIGGSSAYSVRTVHSAQARVAAANRLAAGANHQARLAVEARDLAIRETDNQKEVSRIAREAAEAARAAEGAANERRNAAVIDRLSSEASRRAASGADLPLAISLATEALRRKADEVNAYQVLQDSLFLARREIGRWPSPQAAVEDVAFVRDQPLAMTFRQSGAVEVVDASSGTTIVREPPPGNCRLSERGTYVACVTASSIHLQALGVARDSRPVRVCPLPPGRVVSYTASEQRVIVVTELGQQPLMSRITVINVETGSTESWDTNVYVMSAASVDGAGKVVLSEIFGKLSIRNLADKTERPAPGIHQGFAMSSSCTKAGEICASVWTDGVLRLWNTDQNTEIDLVAKGASGRPAFSKDGSKLAVIISNAVIGGNSVNVWDVASATVVAQLSIDGRPNSVAFNSDGRSLLVGVESDKLLGGGSVDRFRNGSAQIFDIGSNPVAALPHSATVNDIAFSPKGDRLLSRPIDSHVCVWDVAAVTSACTVVEKGGAVALGTDDKLLLEDRPYGGVVDLRTGKLVIKGGSSAYKPAAFSQDGNRFARFSGSTLEVFDTASGRLVGSTAVSGDAIQLAIDRGGHRVIYSTRNPVESTWVFDVERNASRGPLAHSVWVYISDNGERGMTAGNGGQLTLWNLNTMRRVNTISDPAWQASVALDPDGTLAAVFGTDQIMRIWNTADSRLIGRMSIPGNRLPFKADKVVFSPDGRNIAVTADRTVRIYPVTRDSLLRLSCVTLPRNLTRQEWSFFVGNEKYRKTCE